ncbi:MAG: lysophospholipid acyltransferase family protein [Solirubrobacteraceae bacterium]|jgi:1-acyl-sn-glycerol-3-phosphate acyltransferase
MEHGYIDQELAERHGAGCPVHDRFPLREPAHAVRRATGERGEATAARDQRPPSERSAELNGFREHTLSRGVNPFLYWTLRALVVPFFLVYFRMRRIGREHLPRRGPLLLASNHRSFLDPFVIGTLVRRPVYYMAKRELFEKRWQAWLLNGLGAFPVDRGVGDGEAMNTAREILAQGDCVVVFPEGTRVRPGPLGEPRRGVGRLALETGAPVVPIAVIGTADVRRGWRIRPRKVRLRVARPLRFPTVEETSPALAAAVTERIWACVSLQWRWLGGTGAVGEEREGPARPRRTPERVGRATQELSGSRGSAREEARTA